jgi:hypothetical protein
METKPLPLVLLNLLVFSRNMLLGAVKAFLPILLAGMGFDGFHIGIPFILLALVSLLLF